MIRSRDQINKLRFDHEYLCSIFGCTWLLCMLCVPASRSSFFFSPSPSQSLSLFCVILPSHTISKVIFSSVIYSIFVGLFIYIWRHAFRRSILNFISIYICICTMFGTSQQLTHKPIGLVVYRFCDMIEMAKGQLKSFFKITLN